MITGTHAIVYAEDAEAARAFFRDVLGLPFVDVHDGWLIFGHHELYLMCDDVEATVADLTAEGVEFTAPIQDQGFGRLTRLRVPGGGELGLYQPRHPVAHDLDD